MYICTGTLHICIVLGNCGGLKGLLDKTVAD